MIQFLDLSSTCGCAVASTRTRASLNNQGPIKCSQSLRIWKVIISLKVSHRAKISILKGIALLPLPENNRITERRNHKKKNNF